MGIGTIVIYDVSKTDNPEWKTHVINGKETEGFLDNVSFIVMEDGIQKKLIKNE